MAQFKLFWENNSETPLDAGRLSSFVNYYSNDSLLYSDDPSLLQNGDGNLKIRPLSKIGLISYETLAALNFNRSFVSHDSRFSPMEVDHVVFRDEHYMNKGSLSFDEPIQNIIANPGFEDDGVDWTFEIDSGLDTVIQYTTEDFYPRLGFDNLKSAKILTGDIYGLSKLTKTIDVSSIGDSISLSFYYKSTDDFYFTLKTGTLDNTTYWNDVTWIGTENRYNLDSVDEWKRIELSQIYTNNVDSIVLEFHIVSINNTFFLDSFLVENKPYCSSFYHEDTDVSILGYNPEIINHEQGTIDFNFFPKFSTAQTLLSLKTNLISDAIKIEATESKFIISFYDTINRDYEVFEHSFAYDSIIDSWSRCSMTWNFDTKKIQFFVGKLPDEDEDLVVNGSQISEFTLPESFRGFQSSELRSLFIGSNEGSHPFRGMIEFFKINSSSMDSSDFLVYLNNYLTMTEPNFKLFESGSESIIVDENLLDEGTFLPSTQYFVLISDNDDGDSATVSVSKNDTHPKGYGWFNSRLIGGFHTDADNNIDLSSIWDISEREDLLISNRLLIGNTRTRKIEDTTDDSKLTPLEIKDEAIFNLNTTFTQSVYGRNRTDGNFLHIDSESGELWLDDIHIDGDTINSVGTDLKLHTEDDNTLSINSHEVLIQSEGTDVKIDDLRILNSTLYTKDGSDLSINTKIDGNNDLYIDTDIFTTNVHSFNLTANEDFNLDIGTDFVVNYNNKIHLNGLTIDNETFISDNSIHLTSNNSHVQVELLKFNYNKLFYGDESKRFIRFYEDLSDPTLENIEISSDNLIKINSPKFEVTADQIIFHADMTNYFQLEDVRIENSKIFTEPGKDLFVGGQGTETSENMSLNSQYSMGINTQALNINVETLSMFSNNLLFNDIKMSGSTIESVNGKTLFLGNVNPIEVLSKIHVLNDFSIGTTTPASKFHVYHDNELNMILESPDDFNSNINFITKSNDGDTGLGNTNTKGWQISGRGDQWSQSSERNSIQFNYWDGASWNSPFIFHNGLLGINTNDPQYSLDVHGNIRLYGDKLIFTNDSSSTPDFELYKTSDTFMIESIGSKVHINNPTTISNELSVGPISGSESDFQLSSSQVNQGFIQTPWLYVSGGIESNERDSTGTGIFFHDGNFNAQQDHISFVTNGVSRMQIQDDGHIKIGNAGTIYPGDETPADNGFLTYHGNFKAYRVYNAVWMDLAECWYKDPSYKFEYGMPVVQTENGIRPARKRAEKGSVGIISNTYGYVLNAKDFDENDFAGSKALPIAISGRVRARCKGKLSIGDEVVADKNNALTKASFYEKIIKRDRILGRVDSISEKDCTIKVY